MNTLPMIDSLYNLLFRCRHSRTSFPLSLSGAEGMYVVCLDCGKHFHYDWKRMRMGPSIDHSPATARKKSKMPYVLAAGALPVLWMAAKAVIGRKPPPAEAEKETSGPPRPGQ